MTIIYVDLLRKVVMKSVSTKNNKVEEVNEVEKQVAQFMKSNIYIKLIQELLFYFTNLY